jgi:hypothetical protein
MNLLRLSHGWGNAGEGVYDRDRGTRVKVAPLTHRAGRVQGEPYAGERQHTEVLAGPIAKHGQRSDADERPDPGNWLFGAG